MKFLVPNYSCLQNPWLGGYRPQIPVLSLSSVLNWICWTPPPNKIPGYATDWFKIMNVKEKKSRGNSVISCLSLPCSMCNIRPNTLWSDLNTTETWQWYMDQNEYNAVSEFRQNGTEWFDISTLWKIQDIKFDERLFMSAGPCIIVVTVE